MKVTAKQTLGLASVILALVCAILLGTGGAALAAEVSVTTDGTYQLVNKVNGSERWMLARELATGRIVANVFDPNDPLDLTFFDCIQTGADDVNYYFFCNISAGGSTWSGAGLANIPVARSFFESGGPGPPPPPGESPCRIYGDRCPAEPTDFEAAGGEITFDNYGSQPGGNVSWVRALILPQSSSGMLVIQGGTTAQPQLVMGFSGNGEVGAGDGRLVFANTGGPGGALCIDASGGRVPTIRAIEERVDFCAICDVGSPVVGRFSGRYQIASGAECAVSGEFRMLRTR